MAPFANLIEVIIYLIPIGIHILVRHYPTITGRGGSHNVPIFGNPEQYYLTRLILD
jgi:hypothetical protein